MNKKKQYPRNRKPNYKTTSPKGDDFNKGNPSVNDPSWYSPSPELANMFANLPYNVMTGMQFNLRTSPAKESVPSICILSYVPGYGSFNSPSDAINISARAAFAFVRKANSGSANYEAADMMTYFMAMDQIYAMALDLGKLLKTVKMYSIMNRDIPRLIFEGYGIDYHDVVEHYNDYLGHYNILIEKINRQFAVPTNMNIYKRRSLLASNYFMDSSSIKGQIYVFRPYGFYLWDGKQEGGSALIWSDEYYTPEGTGASFASFLSTFEKYINVLIAQQDLSIMSGDILKAYGVENTFNLPIVTGTEVIAPIYDEYVLNQIENAIVLGPCKGEESATTSQLSIGNVVQSDNTLTCSNQLKCFDGTSKSLATAIKSYHSFLLNSHKDHPSADDNLEFTRLMLAFDVKTSSDAMIVEVDYSTEWIVDVVFGRNRWAQSDATSVTSWVRPFRSGGGLTTPTSSWSGTIDTIGPMMLFDWHPFFYGYVSSSGSVQASFIPYGDVKVATPLSIANLRSMHDCARMGLYNMTMRAIEARR